MPTKKEIQDQIDALTTSLADADDSDGYETVSRRTLSDGSVEETFRVKKTHRIFDWLRDPAEKETEDGGDGKEDEGKEDPTPKNRNKYFGG